MSRFSRFPHMIVGVVILFLLAACATPASEPPAIPPAPTAGGVDSPPASDTPTFEVGPVIARLGSLDCPDSCVGHTFSAPPEMILYADGRLITNELLSQEDGSMEFRLLEQKLSTQKVCALLNTVEQTGFFDYDSTEYEQAAATAGLASNTWIEVNGKRSKQMYLHALREFMEGADYLQVQVEVDPALRDTYRLLETLATGEGTIYQPGRVAVWIRSIEDVFEMDVPDERGEWPLEQPTLAQLVDQTFGESETGIIEVSIDGPNAAALYDLFDAAPYPHTPRIYSENGQLYAVAVRGLLPYEILGGEVGTPPVIPDPTLPVETTQLTCSPDDGLMEIPD